MTARNDVWNHFCCECLWMQQCPATGLAMCRRHAPRPVSTGVRQVVRWPALEDGHSQMACGDLQHDVMPINSISPSTGSKAGGTIVTINTDYMFVTTPKVTFNGVPATNVSVNGMHGRITCTTPAKQGAVGAVDVVVDHGIVSTTAKGGFTYT